MRFLSEYSGAAESELANREARVFISSIGDGMRLGTIYGCQFLLNGHVVRVETFEGHNQHYAEDAAENYVLGIKQILLT